MHQYFGKILIIKSMVLSTILFLVGCRSYSPSSDTKIVGGTLVDKTDADIYNATLLFDMGKKKGICSATLIGPNHAVTAAHCFDKGLGAGAKLYMGSNAEIPVSDRIIGHAVHPYYTVGLRRSAQRPVSDIAIIAFETSLTLNPVSIASPMQVVFSKPLLIAGFGVTGERESDAGKLRQTDAQVLFANKNGREFWQSIGQAQGTCYGDSGGPAYTRTDNQLLLMGATSRGYQCNIGNGIYTDVTQFQGWMKCSFEKLGRPLPSLLNDESRNECAAIAGSEAGQSAAGNPLKTSSLLSLILKLLGLIN